MRFNFFVLSLCFLLLVACDNNKSSSTSRNHSDTLQKQGSNKKVINQYIGNDTFRELIFYRKDSIVESVLRYKNNKLHGTTESYYPNGKLKHTKTFIDDHAYGNFVQYDEDGQITSYSFLIDSIHNSYQILFNENQRAIKELGSPIVDKKIIKDSGNDTLKITFLLSTFYYGEQIKFQIRENERAYRGLKTQKHPELENILVANYYSLLQSADRKRIVTKITVLDTSINTYVNIYDTLYFNY